MTTATNIPSPHARSPVTRSASPSIPAVLAEAFCEDPMMRHVFPEPRTRTERLVRLFAGSQRHAVLTGGGAASTDAAAALWLPLQRLEMTAGDVLRAGMLGLPLAIGLASFRRLDRHEAEAARVLASLAREPSAYLWCIGTTLAARGTGQGRAVLARALADMAGYRRVLLKTENERNLTFYASCGFELVARVVVQASGFPMWVMARPLDRGGQR